jgi:hypothetical protein
LPLEFDAPARVESVCLVELDLLDEPPAERSPPFSAPPFSDSPLALFSLLHPAIAKTSAVPRTIVRIAIYVSFNVEPLHGHCAT